MSRIRVYHPQTNEPFDVPVNKASELRLNHGWNTHKTVDEAPPEAAVQNSPVEPRGRKPRRERITLSVQDEQPTEDFSSLLSDE